MAFEDLFRISSHAVIMNKQEEVLLLKATYGQCGWGLPGGALDPAETIHDALVRECKEEIGAEVAVLYLSGVYYHQAFNSQACVFRCELTDLDKPIVLNYEHSEYRYFPLDELSEIQKIRVLDCLNFDGKVRSNKF